MIDETAEVRKHLGKWKVETPDFQDGGDFVFSLVPIPIKDELLSSWLCRTARAHYTGYKEFIKALVDTDYKVMSNPSKSTFWNVDIDRKCPEPLRNLIIRRTGIDLDSFDTMSIIKWDSNTIDQFIARTNRKDIDGIRYCPLCLKEDKTPHYRRNWRSLFYSICPIHEIMMYAHCPNPKCKNAIQFNKIDFKKPFISCHACGTDLSTAIPIPFQNSSYLEAMNNLLQVLQEGYFSTRNGETYTSKVFFETLYILSRFIYRIRHRHPDLKDLQDSQFPRKLETKIRERYKDFF
jgi:hypothetical protein